MDPSTSSTNKQTLILESPPNTPINPITSNETAKIATPMEKIPVTPIGFPFFNVASNLDPDAIAVATAAAAAAFQDAIAARTNRVNAVPKDTPPRLCTYLSSTPPTPTSPSRNSFGDHSSQSPYYLDQATFPSISPASTGNNRKMSFPPRPVNRNRANSGAEEEAETTEEVSEVKPERDSKKLNLYKTELCRSWEETGTCRYGNKCQFAHSGEEVRNIDRHPKYKTEMCKTFWEKGTCPYGKRCCFIHTEKLEKERSAPPPIQITPPRPRSNSSKGFEESPRKNKGSFSDRNGLASAPTDFKSYFDPVQDGFSFWPPVSPEGSFAYEQKSGSYPGSFSTKNDQNPTEPISQYPGNFSLNQVEHALQNYHISSSLESAPPANPLALLSPITSKSSSEFRPDHSVYRTALSSTNFFSEPNFESVPILSTPPRGLTKKTESIFSPIGAQPIGAQFAPAAEKKQATISPTFSQVSYSQAIRQSRGDESRNVLKKFDSGVSFYEEQK